MRLGPQRNHGAALQKYQGAARRRDPLQSLGGATKKRPGALAKKAKEASPSSGWSALAEFAAPALGAVIGSVGSLITQKTAINAAEKEAARAQAAEAEEAARERAHAAEQARLDREQQAADRAHALAVREQEQRLAREHAEAITALERKERNLRAEEQRQEDARLASRYQSEHHSTQSQQQALAFVNQMKARYPHVFEAFPSTARKIEGEALAVLLAPKDPGSPTYVRDALNEIEFHLSQSEGRLKPGDVAPSLAALSPAYDPQALKAAANPKPPPKRTKTLAYAAGGIGRPGSRSSRRRPTMFGGALVGVARA
jgi:hypothetical protein